MKIICIFIITRSIVLRKRHVLDRSSRSKTHISCSKTFFENRAIHVIMWKKYSKVKQAKDDISVQAACSLGNQGYRHNSEYFMLNPLPLKSC
jgi:hypothetical protein